MDPTKVLLVDDEESSRFMLRECLDDVGYELLEADNGQQALEIVEREQPDVILLDVTMPGLDGMAVLKKLQEQEHTRHIPTIMVTGRDQDTQISASLDAGAIDHITKPFSKLVVQARVRWALRNRAASTSEPPSGPRGKLIGFIGSKGGVGNTTVAVNVALSLASGGFLTEGDTSVLTPGRKVVLVELRPNLGIVSHQLGLSAGPNLKRLLDNEDPSGINAKAVEECLARHLQRLGYGRTEFITVTPIS